MESLNVTKQEGIIILIILRIPKWQSQLKTSSLRQCKKKMTSPLLTEIIADIREKADKNI